MKLASIITASAVLLSACTGSVPPPIVPGADVLVLRDKNTKGGDLKETYSHVVALQEEGTSVRIVADTVTSAGTFYLGAPDACMANRNTVFRFHGPQNTAAAVLVAAFTIIPPPVSFMAKDKADHVRNLMAEFYESHYDGLGAWFMENAANKAGAALTNLTATEMNAMFGVPFCEGI